VGAGADYTTNKPFAVEIDVTNPAAPANFGVVEPNVSGTFYGVSCPSRYCLAVGQDFSNGAPLVASISVVTSPSILNTGDIAANFGSVNGPLNSVECQGSLIPVISPAIAPTYCVGVGVDYSTGEPFVDHIDLSRPLVLAANPAVLVNRGSGFSVFNSVACPVAGQCIAAGIGHGQPIVESVEHNTVPILSPAPTDVPGTTLGSGSYNAVACPTTVLCVGVGNDAVFGRAFYATFDPTTGVTGAITDVLAPSGTGTGTFAGIACPTADLCVAVGQDTSSNQPFYATFDPTTGKPAIGGTQDVGSNNALKQRDGIHPNAAGAAVIAARLAPVVVRALKARA
jgi:hypothetical protein